MADTWWHAKTALDALPIQWNEGAGAAQTSAAIARHLDDGLAATTAFAQRNEGDALKAITGAARRVEATYATPFLAHATMEPMNCTARVTADAAEIWVPTQNAEAAHAAMSEESGLPLGRCAVHRLDPGGSFARRGGRQDYVRQAIAIAKQFPNTPVKLLWSREEDQAHDLYRPISVYKLTADGDRAELRLLGRGRRADDLRGHAQRAQRSCRRHRQAGAQPAAEAREARVGVSFVRGCGGPLPRSYVSRSQAFFALAQARRTARLCARRGGTALAAIEPGFRGHCRPLISEKRTDR